MASTALMTARIARWHLHWSIGSQTVFGFSASVAELLSYTFILLLIAYDIWATRRIHRATVWAGAFLIGFQQLALHFGRMSVWHAFAGGCNLSASLFIWKAAEGGCVSRENDGGASLCAPLFAVPGRMASLSFGWELRLNPTFQCAATVPSHPGLIWANSSATRLICAAGRFVPFDHLLNPSSMVMWLLQRLW